MTKKKMSFPRKRESRIKRVWIPNVDSQGETVEEAKKNIIEAVTLYLETAIESNLPIIRPVPEEDNPLKLTPEEFIKTLKVNVDLK